MASQANMSEGPASRVAGEVPLVGDAGQEFVQSTLSTHDPATAIAEIQDRGSLRDPRCRPLMGLLDQLGAPRSESHQIVVKRATDALLARIPSLSPEQLLRLLEASFPFIGISDLRAIPIAVLDRLRPVPATFLKQLAVDREVFWELPPEVQRQAWELDRKLLQVHALSLLAAYTYETATLLQDLNMDRSLPDSLVEVGSGSAAGDVGGSSGGTAGTGIATTTTATAPAVHHKLPQLARRNLRNGSAALRRLTAMVGRSRVVYKGIVELCIARYRDSEAPYVGIKEAAICALRSQLLMSLHDAGETGICVAEPCYKLAFTLDAGLKDKKFDKKRLKELATICNGFAEAEKNRNRLASRPSSGGGKYKASGKRVRDDDAESAGVPGANNIEDPLRELSDAGMVLRDPAPFHLMLHQILRCLERCVSDAKVPKDDRELVLLTRMLTLAVLSRPMLRDQDYFFPEPNPEVLNTLYPLVADMMLEAELRGDEDEDGAGGGFKEEMEPPTELVNLLIRDEISRKVVQTYALERLAAGDLITGRLVLRAVAACLDRLSDRAVPEFAPFAFTLARRLATLYADGRLDPTHPLWSVAVDGVLICLVDAETEVHEEVLRLLLAAAPVLEPSYLSTCLTSTLANSRKSRKLHKKRAIEEAALPAGYYDDDGIAGGYSTAEGYGGSPKIQGGRGADGVRGTYHLFLQKQQALNRKIAPALFTYLDASG